MMGLCVACHAHGRPVLMLRVAIGFCAARCVVVYFSDKRYCNNDRGDPNITKD